MCNEEWTRDSITKFGSEANINSMQEDEFLVFLVFLENLSQELGLITGFFSISPLRVIRIGQTQICRMYIANIKVYRPLLTNVLIVLIFFLDKNI